MKRTEADGPHLNKVIRSELNEERVGEFAETHDLKYYNYDVHLASLAIPNSIKKMLQSH